jgi:addiction module HigA family antidote
MAQQNQYFPQSRPHPGETLEEKLEEMGMGPKEFAIRVAKPEKTITAVLKGESSITPDMAVQFEKVTKIPAQFWMNHQQSYDEYKARVKHEEAIEAAVEWAKSFPVAAMARCGWIAKQTTWKGKAAELLAFFGFANHKAWEQYYFNQQLKIAFRVSLSGTSQPYAISAWLRKGQLQAAELAVEAYNEKVFKSQLSKIKTLIAKHPKDFFEQLQSLCAEAGVKVVHTPCLPKVPLNGATRWINDNPLIQLTGRHKRNDIFWFTFFHEAGHIILHRKKDIFLEDVEYSDKDMEKEKEADDFAAEWLLTEEEEQTIIHTALLDEETIQQFAKQFNTHPAIIAGRLQHKKLMPYAQGKSFFEKVELE